MGTDSLLGRMASMGLGNWEILAQHIMGVRRTGYCGLALQDTPYANIEYETSMEALGLFGATMAATATEPQVSSKGDKGVGTMPKKVWQGHRACRAASSQPKGPTTPSPSFRVLASI